MGARQLLCTAAVVSLLLSSAAAAHHSFVVVYDTERSQQVTGSIIGFLFRNPHTLLQVEAIDAAGHRQRWTAEWASRGQLVRDGITAVPLRCPPALWSVLVFSKR